MVEAVTLWLWMIQEFKKYHKEIEYIESHLYDDIDNKEDKHKQLLADAMEDYILKHYSKR